MIAKKTLSLAFRAVLTWKTLVAASDGAGGDTLHISPHALQHKQVPRVVSVVV